MMWDGVTDTQVIWILLCLDFDPLRFRYSAPKYGRYKVTEQLSMQMINF